MLPHYYQPHFILWECVLITGGGGSIGSELCCQVLQCAPSRGIDKYRPQVVFHSASHKHVPLMEHNSIEAITNNVIGMRNLLNVCQQYNVAAITRS